MSNTRLPGASFSNSQKANRTVYRAEPSVGSASGSVHCPSPLAPEQNSQGVWVPSISSRAGSWPK